MKIPIYLDYAATTPVDKRVANKMMKYLTINGNFGNPSSKSHFYGWQAEEAVNISRKQIAKLINANPRDIIFTSGATEANNLAIKGTALFYQKKGKHIITSKTEHKSVLDSCKHLENIGFKVTYLIPRKNGIIDLQLLEEKLTNDTILISIMHVNNEIGVIQDIRKIGEICRKNNIIFHVDATQSIGKLPIDLNSLPVDQMSFSAHKIYGPKGIGALYLRSSNNSINLLSQIHGGKHERGLRAGTLPVHQIVGMGEAYDIAKKELKNQFIHMKNIRNCFVDLIKKIDNIHFNSDLEKSIFNILNISFDNIDAEFMLIILKDLALSSSSACTSHLESSYVLKSLGINDDLINSAIRFSFGKFTTIEEINYAVSLIDKTVKKLRS